MDVPVQRKGDPRWLLRNLAIRNSQHHDFEEAITLLKELSLQLVNPLSDEEAKMWHGIWDKQKKDSLGRQAQNDSDVKSIEWKCPKTGISIRAHFWDGELYGEYELYHYDGSFLGVFPNFYHARNWAKKHLDRDCMIPALGVRWKGEVTKNG